MKTTAITDFKDKKILVTGGTGFLGQAVVEYFRKELKDTAYIYAANSFSGGDLKQMHNARTLIHGFNIVVHLAADCGGIGYNRENPGWLFYANMQIGLNVIEACRQAEVEKLIVIGTVCAYPKDTKVPFDEATLWNGFPEETNAPYGVAKRALLTMAQAYRQQYGMNIVYLLMVNLYGVGDQGFFKPETAHVIPAMIAKFVMAKESDASCVELWGSGTPSREFLYVRDAAEAIFLATKYYDEEGPINIGSGQEISILDLAQLIAKLVGYEKEIIFNTAYPDGQPRRCLDVSKAKKLFQFTARTSFIDGLKQTIDWYLEMREHYRTYRS